MTDEVRIVLAGEPKGKGRPRFSVRGGKPRAFTPAATRTYEDVLRYTAQEAMGRRLPLTGPLEMSMLAVMPVPSSWSKAKRADALAGWVQPTGKPDMDNMLKMCDALNYVVFGDDAQITTLGRVWKRYGERPRVELVIRPAPLVPADTWSVDDAMREMF